MNDLVSVVIPAFNSESTIEETVRSVLAQSYLHIEVIVVDDCSSDSTGAIVSGIGATDSRVKIVRLPVNVGGGLSRNEGLKLAAGRFIAFCDSDDTWDVQKLEIQLEAMRRCGADISCTAYRIKAEALDANRKIITPPEEIYFRTLLQTNCIAMSTSMIDRAGLDEFKLPSLRLRQDYALWLTLAKSGAKIIGLSDVLATYRRGAGSLSSNKVRAARWHWHVLRNYGSSSFLKCLSLFVVYIYHATKKRAT